MKNKRTLLTVVMLLFGPASLLRADERGSFDRTLNVSGPVELNVESGSGHISVHAGPAGKVAVHGEVIARWNGAAEKVRRLQQNPPIEQNGASIRIGHIADEDLRHDVSISYDVTVPAETRVDAHTGSGGIEVTGVRRDVKAQTGSGSVRAGEIASAVDLRTGSGGITIEDIGGNVYAHTGNGGIHGTGLGTARGGPATTIVVETGSGGIQLDQVRGSLQAHAGSGHVTIGGEPTGNWKVDTGSGGVDLKLPAKAAFEVRAHTGSGGIRVDYPITMEGALGDRHRVEGKVGGGGPLIEVHTGSGGVHIGSGGSQPL